LQAYLLMQVRFSHGWPPRQLLSCYINSFEAFWLRFSLSFLLLLLYVLRGFTSAILRNLSANKCLNSRSVEITACVVLSSRNNAVNTADCLILFALCYLHKCNIRLLKNRIYFNFLLWMPYNKCTRVSIKAHRVQSIQFIIHSWQTKLLWYTEVKMQQSLCCCTAND